MSREVSLCFLTLFSQLLQLSRHLFFSFVLPVLFQVPIAQYSPSHFHSLGVRTSFLSPWSILPSVCSQRVSECGIIAYLYLCKSYSPFSTEKTSALLATRYPAMLTWPTECNRMAEMTAALRKVRSHVVRELAVSVVTCLSSLSVPYDQGRYSQFLLRISPNIKKSGAKVRPKVLSRHPQILLFLYPGRAICLIDCSPS